jgi:hypothetical protein
MNTPRSGTDHASDLAQVLQADDYLGCCTKSHLRHSKLLLHQLGNQKPQNPEIRHTSKI